MATVTRELSCPPSAVLDVLADGWSYATWVVGTSRIRAVDPAWPAPGTEIAHSFGLWPALLDDVTVARGWDPERGIDLQARGWPAGEARVQIEVRPRTGGGCTVRLTEDAVRGPGTLVPRPLRTAALVPRNTETLRRLAFLAEGRARS
ncbi:SRPBCC family protein [Cellulomonas xylanilytica]|uniref:Polyketide cyclase n=1 Tax=Cellulomonas xylanilytica TaxID=233583 RepID=A0A510V223_9CELL|nr:SRPBCC family protein [Cellulomonas xylanilytica]GEK20909.1 polyketide cyclase [Cellulomonas xylanilytica]